MKTGEKIRLFRLLYSMSQEDLALELGISQRNVAQIEMGRYRASDILTNDIAKCFNLSPGWLADNTGAPFVPSLLFIAVPAGKTKTFRMVNDISSMVRDKWPRFLTENEVKECHLFNNQVYVYPIRGSLFLIYSRLHGAFIRSAELSNIKLSYHSIQPMLTKENLQAFVRGILKNMGYSGKEAAKIKRNQVIQIFKEEDKKKMKLKQIVKITNIMDEHNITVDEIEKYWFFREKVETDLGG